MAQEKDLKAQKAEWEKKVFEALKSHPERSSEFFTTSSMDIDRLYTPLDISELEYRGDLGFPGKFPFTRGVQPTMYRGRIWTMRQYAGFGSAEESNARYRFLLGQGQTGLSVAFDLPTQIGYDSDHPLSSGEVGKVGVAIDSLSDMEILFEGIPLDKISTSMTINSPASILLAMYIALAEKQNADVKGLRGTIQNDILKEYTARGTYIFPPKPSMRLITDVFEYCNKSLPKWNTISISGYHIREAGSTAAQEVAFTLADGIAYVEAAISKGLAVDDFAPRLAFFFNSHNDLFEEVAKLRAARRLWARIMKERFSAKSSKSCMLRFHTQTAGCSLTAQQPENNVVRVTLQALAAVLGGTQSLHTNSMDEALALPTEEAVRTALRTQQIIAHESGAINTIDPFAGSYFLEALTSRIEKEALDYIKKIDDMGGMLVAVEKGYIQREIHESAYTYQRQIERGERLIVGVNCFTTKKKIPIKTLKIPPEIENKQVERLKKLRMERDNSKVKETLSNLRVVAQGEENTMPVILEAVRAYATLGEICDVLRDVFGEYKAPNIF
ncbi:MAG: methylmalonyl-CoA mutase family protein [Thermoplasmata archaeon]|nr:MAG: methylmalonyl-CoA mutase family protein [Thermoplasmata archaeon]